MVVVAATGMLIGCQSAQSYREEADEVAYDIVREGQREAWGHNEPFTIESPEQALRRRLLEMQGLATAAPVSRGSDKLEPTEHWPDDPYLQRERPDPHDIVDVPPIGPVTLDLTQALQVAARNSRSYQQRKEQVFGAALNLDLERDAFDATLNGMIRNLFTSNLDGRTDTTGVVSTGDFGVEQQLKNGVSLASSIVIDLARMLRPDGGVSEGLLVDFSVTIPLLAGSGEHIVTEPLTQAQRNVLYELWQFDRFKRTFAVGVASDYLNVLQQLDRVANAENNYRRLIESALRSRALADAGRLSEIQVDQVNQDVLRARDQWIGARESYARQLDGFKITLGLPTDARMVLDPNELQRLADRGRVAMGQDDGAVEIDPAYTVDGNNVTINEPTNQRHGRLELPEDQAVRLALDHRRDMQVQLDQVEDAQRDVVIAADGLRPGLTLAGGGSFGERRGVGSADEPRAELRPERGDYNVALTFDLPWEKTSERNAYRNALIALERSVRDVQELEDQIKLDVRNALRQLRQARESFMIQARAVELAARRVDSTNLFLKAGRAAIRDVLEAEEDLVNAQDALTDALVNYRVAELELQRDMGVLEVNAEGLWREYISD